MVFLLNRIKSESQFLLVLRIHHPKTVEVFYPFFLQLLLHLNYNLPSGLSSLVVRLESP